MGGGWYDDGDAVRGGMGSAALHSATGYSSVAEEVMRANMMHEDMDPRGRELMCDAQTPIVIAIDVTGSMGDWSKIIWDKLPMFFGQLKLQDYCPGPAISFAGIGDAPAGDQAPLQVSNFASGGVLDGWISKIWLEGLGGGNQRESYDLACSFYSSRVVFTGLRPGEKPFFFITGDEGLYETVQRAYVHQWVGDSSEPTYGTTPVLIQLPADLEAGVRRVSVELPDGSVQPASLPPGFQPGETAEFEVEGQLWSMERLFDSLRQTYHVFHLHKPYHSPQPEERIYKQWALLVGEENVLCLKHPKSVVDVMLGAIALRSGSRTMEEYVEDLQLRGQTEDRIADVREALAGVKVWDPSAPSEMRIGKQLLRAKKVEACTGLEVCCLELQQQLRDFLKEGTPNSTHSLPPTLTDWQKKNLHMWASRNGLMSRSVGQGASRHLTVTQPDVPMKFSDPITHKLMQDPVVGPDGHVYEYESITHWLSTNSESPVTGAVLPHKNVVRCESMAQDISAWRVKHHR